MKMSNWLQCLARTMAIALAIVVCAEPASVVAAELVVFSSKDCVVTKKFRHETTEQYRQTKAAQTFPLRFTNIEMGSAGVALEKPVTMSPTFVFVDKNREIARIAGYPGRAYFLRLTEGAADAFLEAKHDR